MALDVAVQVIQKSGALAVDRTDEIWSVDSGGAPVDGDRHTPGPADGELEPPALDGSHAARLAAVPVGA